MFDPNTEECEIRPGALGVQEIASWGGSTSERLLTPQLVALAGEMDPSITERTLEHWRYQGLLSRPERSGQDGKRPVWTYSAETADQLRALLHWREQTRDPDVLLAALWYEGFLIDTGRARNSIGNYLRQLRASCEKELAKRSTTPNDPEARWEAIEAVARVMARKRGKGFPRLSRQSLDDRTTAISLTLGLVLGDQHATERLESHAPAVEKLIGVDRGRRVHPGGVGPWLDGPAEVGLASFAQIGSLDRLIAVVDRAGEDELKTARGLGRTLLGGISAFSRIADAMVGRDNASGMAGIRLLDDDPHAAMFVVPLVLSILASSELAENLGQIIAAIQTNVVPVEQMARDLVGLSKEDQAERLSDLSQLPFAEQLKVRRLLIEFEDHTKPIDR